MIRFNEANGSKVTSSTPGKHTILGLSPPLTIPSLDATTAPVAGSSYVNGIDGGINSTIPVDYAETTFISGISRDGTVSSSSFWGYEGTTAHKWGGSTAGSGGGTVTYHFDAASGWTAVEQATFRECFALWQSIANISFVETSSGSADALLVRGTSGGASTAVSATTGSGRTLGTSSGQATISLQTDQPGFDASGSFTAIGGYGVGTIVHEMGHLIGLGHAGPYNGAVDPSTQQFGPQDDRLWSIMSYIDWNSPSPKYASNYPVTGTNWGTGADGYDRQQSTTWMPLDVVAAQQLYGAPTRSVLTGGQCFGFSCNVDASIRKFFDFTVNTSPVVTLYDQGSNNKLDLSGYGAMSTVDLRDGHFSSFAGMTNNLGIAYGTKIDAAVGGAGNDTFIVNGDGDRIDGGGGTNSAIFLGVRSSYALARWGTGVTITRAGTAVTDTLQSIQSLQFSDTTTLTSTLSHVASISSAGGQTGRALTQTQALVDAAATDTVFMQQGFAGLVPPPPAPGAVLVLPAALTGVVTVPSGYAGVVVSPGDVVTLRGGDASLAVMSAGQLDYRGGAVVIDSFGANSSLLDTAQGATVVAGGRNVSVTLGAAAQTLLVDSGSLGHYLVTGGGDTVVLGSVGSVGGSLVVGGAGSAASVAAEAVASATAFTANVDGVAGGGNTYSLIDPGGLNLVALGLSDTVNALAGLSTIFGLGHDSVSAGAGGVLFVGGAGVSTVVGGTANSTVFATSGQVFDVGAAQANVFVGGTAASTINAGAGGGTFFGGIHGDSYSFGTGAAQVFLGLGGADTLNGGAGTVAPKIFAIGAEHLVFAAATRSVTVVSFAAGGSIDMSSTAGNDVVFAGYGAGGNQTLIGSPTVADATGATTHDQFVVGANPSNAPTTVTIDDWHGGDVFYLTGFAAADTTTMDTAIGNGLGRGAVGDLTFTLSDMTTIAFVGSHPTNFGGNAAF